MPTPKSTNKYITPGMSLEQCAFQTRSQMVAAMSNPLYVTDPEFRDLVGWMANQPFSDDEPIPGERPGTPQGRALEIAMADRDGARRAEDLQILHEQTAALFGDERYSKSPTFRREVQEFLKANDAELSAMAGNSLIDRNINKGAYRVQLGNTEDHVAAIRADQKAQAEVEAQERKAEAHRKIDAGEDPDFESPGGIFSIK